MSIAPDCRCLWECDTDGKWRRSEPHPECPTPHAGTTTIPLPWSKPPLTQNELRRMHHLTEARAKSIMLDQARLAVRAKGVPFMAGAIVILHWRQPDRRRRDGDGAAPTLKVCLDALVKEGVLHDDSWVEVPHSGITVHPPIKGQPGAMWLSLADPDREAS